MKIVERLSVILLLITGVCFVFFYWEKSKNTDTINPEMTCEEMSLSVSVNVTEKELLEGITAWDNVDGDLTDKIIIASYSKFINLNEATRNVKYIVFDSHNNVSQIVREIKYTDYEPPKYYLKQPLRFRVNSSINLYECIGATDCLDGDVSDKIKVVYNDAGTINNTPGEYGVQFQVANSAGDVSYLTANVEIYEGSYYKPTIELSDYLIHIEKGSEFNPLDYVVELTSALEEEELTTADVQVYGKINRFRAGTYELVYSVVSTNGYEGTNRLVVIVKE